MCIQNSIMEKLQHIRLNYSSVMSLGSIETQHFPGHLTCVTSLDTTTDPLITHIFCAGTAP